MQKSFILFIGLCWAGVSLSAPDVLTLEQALETAHKNAPELQAARTNIEAAEQAVAGADYWQAPIIDFEAEGIGGGEDSEEYTLLLKKKFRRGDKSTKERTVAQQAVRVVRQAESEAQLELTARVKSAFYEAISQQEIAIVRTEQETLARDFVADATKRFNAGAASELDVLQADLALEEVLIEKQCCFGDLDSAKKTLAALMGIEFETLGTLDAAFYNLQPPSSLIVSGQHPALRRLQEQEATLHAAADLAISQDKTYIMFGAGVKYDASFSEPSYVFDFSMPLALSRRGRAEGASHSLKAQAIHSESEQVRRDLQLKLSASNTIYQRATSEAVKYKVDLIPKAEKIYTLSRAGYDAGRYSWLELIVAQQHLSEIRIRFIEALSTAHQSHAEMEKYIGQQPAI